jgi:hypothetical protein
MLLTLVFARHCSDLVCAGEAAKGKLSNIIYIAFGRIRSIIRLCGDDTGLLVLQAAE